MFHPQQQIGPYILIRLLGRGGFGEVWLAQNPDDLLNPQVALKLPLDPDPDLDAIRHEAQTWLRASGHLNVLPVIEARVYSGQVVIASEYAAGGSLKDWLKQQGGKAPTVEVALEMSASILSGLEHLHSLKPKPIIHRDLKPDNVLLQEGVPRLTDFGISRVLKTTEQTKHASGTPHYMPPEAFAGKYSAQSDIWAAGVMLYQMLSGNLPFPQADMPSLYGAILTGTPPPLPADVPQALKTAVAKALAKDPAHRFASVAEMQAALKRVSMPVVSAPIVVPPKPAPERNNLAAYVPGCTMILCTVFCVVWRAVYIYTVDVPKEGLSVDLWNRFISLFGAGASGFGLSVLIVLVFGGVSEGIKYLRNSQK